MEGQPERAHESIERARAVLAASGDRLDRSEAALKRLAARVAREQADVDKSVAHSERDLQRQPPDPGDLIERAATLRNQIAAAIADLASTEEAIARMHDELAARYPRQSGEHLRAADEARTAARLARETGRRLNEE